MRPVTQLSARSFKPRASGIAVWRPEIVLPRPERSDARPIVIAEPGFRPEAIRAQIEASRSALAAFAETQATLDAQAAALHEQVREGATERDRVSAVMETYRIKTALDEAFRSTMRRVGALMEDRGRR